MIINKNVYLSMTSVHKGRILSEGSFYKNQSLSKKRIPATITVSIPEPEISRDKLNDYLKLYFTPTVAEEVLSDIFKETDPEKPEPERTATITESKYNEITDLMRCLPEDESFKKQIEYSEKLFGKSEGEG